MLDPTAAADAPRWSPADQNALLASVSRSFYLTIRALPETLRGPIRNAYLLARASDTLADSAFLSGEEKRRHLEELAEILEGRAGLDQAAAISLQTASRQEDPGEKKLLLLLVEVLLEYQALAPADREDVRWVLAQIIAGQLGDIDFREMPDRAALELYTWRVAGSVGEFWTRLCQRRLPRYATLPEAEMIRLGSDYGSGLQMVNILRDQVADRKLGRNYLPPGTTWRDWVPQTEVLLGQGARYFLALRSWRLRFACALPVLFGFRTLRLLGTDRKKISRQEVWSIVFGVLLRVGSVRLLDRYCRRLRR